MQKIEMFRSRLPVILELSNVEAARPVGHDGLTFWKEVAYAGTFKKRGQTIRLSKKLFDHWKRTFDEQRANGDLDHLPLPVEHTRDPEKKRGRIIALASRPNKSGIDAIYAKVRFRDHEAAKLRDSGVSVFSPAQQEFGSGRTYVRPLEHVCITDSPVVPRMEPYSIALSFNDDASKKDSDKEKKPDQPQSPPNSQQNPQTNPQQAQKMSVRDLATQLGVDASITDEQQLLQAITNVIAQLKARAQAPMPPARPIVNTQIQPGYGPPAMHTGRPPMAMAFDESKHPRGKKGTHEGGKFTTATNASKTANTKTREARSSGSANAHAIAARAHKAALEAYNAPELNDPTRVTADEAYHRTQKSIEHENMAKYHDDLAKKLKKTSLSLALSRLTEDDVMAMSKKQFKKLKKNLTSKLNERSHFGQERIAGPDEDDTYKDEDNDAFASGCDNEDDEDTFSGRGRKDTTLALSGSVLGVVKNARKTTIDALVRSGAATPATAKQLTADFVDNENVALSHEHDDGFDYVVSLLKNNGRVLPGGKSGAQVSAGQAVALSHEPEGDSNPLIADAEERAKNFRR
jgi:hypothetical protein